MKALLIIDVQNDFCPGGALPAPHGDKVVPVINKLMEKFPLVIASKDWHPEKSIHFDIWPVHCVQNSKGAEFHPNLRKEKIDQVLLKGTTYEDHGYSVFGAANINFENFLKEKGIDELYIGGLVTEYCVKTSALDCVKHSIKTIVIEDAIQPFDNNEGEVSIREMKSMGITFIKSDELEKETLMDTSMENENKKCTIRFMGDVMLGRLVNSCVDTKDYKYPWGNVLPILQSPGINIINLENAFTESKNEVPKVFNFKADPDKIEILKEGNINIANIANNHILDYSVEGMIDTLNILDEAGIKHVGAGMDLKEAKTPAIYHYENIKIGIIGCTDNEPTWKANGHPGTFYVRVGDQEALKKEITSLRKNVDILIVSIHWGPNMVEEPPRSEIEFAHHLIDLGADIIHGHSAHIFQGLEIYKGKVILYDTGDFIDDYVVDPVLRNDHSFLFELQITGQKISEVKLTPVVIRHMQVNLAKKYDKNWAIARMQTLSEKLGTKIQDTGEVIFE